MACIFLHRLNELLVKLRDKGNTVIVVEHDPDVIKVADYIVDVGLHYMTLGQPLDTLSGGECQRLKLAKELSKKGNIYIKGNTVIVIEHNLDVIRNADWIIDVGVEGGSGGGQILFEGTPGNLKNCKESITAKCL